MASTPLLSSSTSFPFLLLPIRVYSSGLNPRTSTLFPSTCIDGYCSLHFLFSIYSFHALTSLFKQKKIIMASEFRASNPGTPVSAVILDLDGTLLDTESVTKGIVGEFLAKYGKELDKEREGKKRLGMTLEVTAASIVLDYDLPLTPDQFVAEIMPMYQEKWSQARAMPGADRLIKHLYKHGVPFALASNSLREYIEEKIAHHKGWKDYFSVILGRDQVKSGKPAPDLFLEAARKMGVDAAQCVVIEDSLVGVKAAKAAKMSVVAVPSPSETDCSLFADSVLSSLLEFQPEQWGLPPFDELVNGESLIEPVRKSTQHEENGSMQEIFGNGTG